MTEESFDCVATAGLLDCASVAAQASHAAAVAAGVATVSSGSLPMALSLIAWPVVCWFAARAALDASLFRSMAFDPTAAAPMLDRYLLRAGLAKPVSGRTLGDRRKGALRLLRSLMIAFAIQLGMLISGVFLAVWSRHA